jgi:hypothetical protein
MPPGTVFGLLRVWHRDLPDYVLKYISRRQRSIPAAAVAQRLSRMRRHEILARFLNRTCHG